MIVGNPMVGKKNPGRTEGKTGLPGLRRENLEATTPQDFPKTEDKIQNRLETVKSSTLGANELPPLPVPR